MFAPSNPEAVVSNGFPRIIDHRSLIIWPRLNRAIEANFWKESGNYAHIFPDNYVKANEIRDTSVQVSRQ